MVGCKEAHNDDMTVLHARCPATSPNMQATWPMTGTWTYAALGKAQVCYLSLSAANLVADSCWNLSTAQDKLVSVAVPACHMNKGCWQNFLRYVYIHA